MKTKDMFETKPYVLRWRWRYSWNVSTKHVLWLQHWHLVLTRLAALLPRQRGSLSLLLQTRRPDRPRDKGDDRSSMRGRMICHTVDRSEPDELNLNQNRWSLGFSSGTISGYGTFADAEIALPASAQDKSEAYDRIAQMPGAILTSIAL
jgi:hypothetical protein